MLFLSLTSKHTFKKKNNFTIYSAANNALCNCQCRTIRLRKVIRKWKKITPFDLHLPCSMSMIRRLSVFVWVNVAISNRKYQRENNFESYWQITSLVFPVKKKPKKSPSSWAVLRVNHVAYVSAVLKRWVFFFFNKNRD